MKPKQPPIPVQTPPVQTIEKTSKLLKAQMATSVCIILFSVVVVVSKSVAGEPSPFGLFLFVSGLVWFIATKVLIWWKHG